jgi:hypothetical protein
VAGRPGSSQYLGLAVSPAEVLDPILWRKRYAWGIALGEGSSRQSLFDRLEEARCKGTQSFQEEIEALDDDEAQAAQFLGVIPDETIRWHLRAAMSEAEYRLGLPMGVNVCKARPVDDGLVKGVHYDEDVGRLPYSAGETRQWFRIDLPRRNIISIERIRAFYFDTQAWDLNTDNGGIDQVKLEWPADGVLHIMPTHIETMIVSTNGNYGVWELLHTAAWRRSPIPDFWAVDFTYGPVTRDRQIGMIPLVLANWISAAAGILILGQAGMAASKGLTSTSISLDGISRSVSLSASAQAGLYGALEANFDKTMERINFDKLRAQMRGPRVRRYY